jgi:tetratricopeptide (TPR) repeat protein
MGSNGSAARLGKVVLMLWILLSAGLTGRAQERGPERLERHGIRPDSFRIILPHWPDWLKEIEESERRERIYLVPEAPVPFIRTGLEKSGTVVTASEQIERARSDFAAAEARRGLGTVNDLREAVRLYEKSLESWRGIKGEGYLRELAQAGNQLALTREELGERIEAIAAFDQARQAWRAAGERQREATTLARIGRLQQTLGLEKQARQSFDQARLILQLTGLTRFTDNRPDRLAGQASMLFNLGKLSEELNQTREAGQFYQQAYDQWQEAADQSGRATALNALGSLAMRSRQILRAKEYFEQALPLWKAVDDTRGLAVTHSNLGYVLESGGGLVAAIESYTAALPYWQKLGDRRGEATARHDIGRLATTLGNLDQAIESLREATRLRRDLGEERGLAVSLSHLGFLSLTRGDLAGARQALEEGLPLIRRGGDSQRLAGILTGLGEVYVALRDWRPARQVLEEAQGIPPAAGTRLDRTPLLGLLARVYTALGDQRQARECYRRLISSWPITLPPLS